MPVSVRREVVLPIDREEVWRALTDAERLAEWFANEVELDPRPGGEGIFRWADGAERRAVVETVDEPARFSFEWGEEGSEETTSVDFTLEEVAQGTRLTVVESAPSTLQACGGEWAWAWELWALAYRPALV